MRLLVALAALLCGFLAGPALAFETVTFPGSGVTLSGVIYRPAGRGPFPAVVALHGCGGLYGRSGGPGPRHADWGERLSAQGFIVLFPDSYRSRGIESLCATADRAVRPARERVADALSAKAYLQSRPDVKADAVSLLGWSNGGSTVLHAVHRGRQARDGRPDFARAVAFYPGCRTPAKGGTWSTRMPLLLLIGEADDWTPAAPCAALAARAGAAVTYVAYPGAVHDFDHPNLRPRTRTGLAYSADGSGTAHTGTDPAARADALARVPAFLAR
ncbi:dienelactone hydrolase family protein [Chelatococcus sp. SYSU_G07232]|uniref:Dienelactone hydrolase family protein n=1 Tax=Chelatococcus albus TaxID=3047466 RepID=A0ABT7ALF3_9HYPH|nr:dienelactone hydrolase family protein [Chelatococcus sp. SYSU_G07232]MDJ1160217.1 dienelactone hydrolase family protein [Chelatococcus sp. SYSU_G07232]